MSLLVLAFVIWIGGATVLLAMVLWLRERQAGAAATHADVPPRQIADDSTVDALTTSTRSD